MKNAAPQGFTLIEMLVIMVIISISVALVYPSLHGIRDKFDTMLETATNERNNKKEAFERFVKDGLPQKKYSSPTKL